jgi:Protein of unknown function (DUF2975)
MDANTSGKANATGSTKRDWLAFGRGDYIVMKVLLALTVVAAALYGLVGPLIDAARNAPLPVSYTTKVTGMPLPRGAASDGEATIEVLLRDATLGERAVHAGPGFFGAAATIAIALLLFQLLRTTQAGDPFIKPNVRRINTIALIVGFVGTLGPLAQGMADSTIYTTGRLPEPETLYIGTISLAPLAVMMVILLIGETFRRGVALRDDVEGLI